MEAAPPYANGPAATISVEELKHPRKLANTIIIVHKISWLGMVVVGWLRVKWARIPKLDEVSCFDEGQKDNKCVT